ncbi:MAG TPA: nucleoside-triphosphatase [Anaerolineales bacterium]|nr:nucleoside-triphosphatase [Anaerolineales bacterium]
MQGSSISPADMVVHYLPYAGSEPALFLVTGGRGSGKTSWCIELLRQARSVGIEPVGLVSPAVFEHGTKAGIDLVCVATGERRNLAVRRQPAVPGSAAQQAGWHKFDWQFFPDVLAWGNQVLDTLPPGELLILDELGPLEFFEQVGFTAGLEQITRQAFKITCVVIRPTLLEQALGRWPWAKIITIADEPGEGNQP